MKHLAIMLSLFTILHGQDLEEKTRSLLDEAFVVGLKKGERNDCILQVKQQGAMQPLLTYLDNQGYERSYFESIDQMAYHPPTQGMAIIGKHRFINRGVRTLFLMNRDGTIHPVIAWKKNTRISGPHRVAESEIQSHLEAATQLIDISSMGKNSKKKMVKLLRKEEVTLFWHPVEYCLYAMGHSHLACFDMEKQKGWIRKLSDQVCPSDGPRFWRLVPMGPNSFGESVFIYHPAQVSKLHWDGQVTPLFYPKKTKMVDLFGTAVSIRYLTCKKKMQVFLKGDCFYLDGVFFDSSGHKRLALDPKTTQFDFAEDESTLFALHKPSRKILLYQWDTDEIVAEHTLPASPKAITALSDASGFVSMDQESENLRIYRLSESREWTSVLLDPVDAAFSSRIGTFFLQDQKLKCADHLGNTCDAPLDLGEQTAWAMFVGDEILFSSIPQVQRGSGDIAAAMIAHEQMMDMQNFFYQTAVQAAIPSGPPM